MEGDERTQVSSDWCTSLPRFLLTTFSSYRGEIHELEKRKREKRKRTIQREKQREEERQERMMHIMESYPQMAPQMSMAQQNGLLPQTYKMPRGPNEGGEFGGQAGGGQDRYTPYQPAADQSGTPYAGSGGRDRY